ncbi:MAG: DUF5615 family PIN-like protein [Opitutaceae bacterium]|jgi:predicted nuclease of predicted toxin-antitoxin system|nr:DUF5615 family PIN-like protein [Opitutaceae bacterium]
MKFKLDENLSPQLAGILEAEGHDAHSVVQQVLGGKPDEQVIHVCQKEDRILITLDLDFSNIQAYPPSRYPGIVVLRPDDQSHTKVAAALRNLLMLLPKETLAGKLWIVESRRIRIRE